MTAQLDMQRLEALTKANEVRFTRAADKLRIKRGELLAASVLREPADHWVRARVLELLLSMPYVGRRKAYRWLMFQSIDPTERIGAISLRERTMLANHVDTWSMQRDAMRRGSC